MLPEQLQPMVNAMGPLFGREIHVSIGNPDATLGASAYAEFSGVLGPWNADGSRVTFNVEHQGSHDWDGFSIDATTFESWGEMDGRVRVVAGGLAILVRTA